MEIDNNIISLARKRILLELHERRGLLNKETSDVIEKMTSRGILHSGITIKELSRVKSEEIKLRVEKAWEVAHRFIQTAGISYSEALADELKKLVEGSMTEDLREIKESAQKLMVIETPLSDLYRKSEAQLHVVRLRELAIINTEIDLFVLHLKNKEKMDKSVSNTHVHMAPHSNVGAIQIGEYSTANIMQNINTEAQTQILQALKDIEVLINRLDSISDCPKSEIIELLHEGQEEIQKQKPNKSKLREHLSTICMSIQTIASLKPAYDLLKVGAASFGINLP